MSQIRTAFISQWFPPEPVQVPLAICSALRRRGHSVEVLTGVPNYPPGRVLDGYKAWKPFRETIDDFPIHRAPVYPYHDASPIKRMLNYISWAVSSTLTGFRVLRRADIAVVYSSPATAALAPMLWRRLTRTPYVLFIQDVWPDSVTASKFIKRGKLSRLIERLLNIFVKMTYNGSSHIAVMSPGMVDLLQSRGVPSQKLTIVYNWANETPIGNAPERVLARRSLGIPDNAFLVTYAGNHGVAQGLDNVVRAASKLGDEKDLLFPFVGDVNRLGPIWELLGYVDDAPTEVNEQLVDSRGSRALGPLYWFDTANPNVQYAIGIGTGPVRRTIDERLSAAGFTPATLIHSSASLGHDVRIQPGVVICAGPRLTNHISLARHVHLNLNTTVGHDSTLGGYVSVNPLVAISGGVTVETEAMLGTHSAVLQNLRIGARSIVGAGSCVVKDVPPDVVVKRVPAR